MIKKQILDWPTTHAMSSSVKAVNAVMPIEMIVAPSISRLLSLQVQNPSCYDARLIHYGE